MTVTMIPHNAKRIIIPGPCGDLECLQFTPPQAVTAGYAIIFHPDPQGGGSFSNKVVQTVAKVLSANGYICYCPNLRGVGTSAGIHDFGQGEVADATAVYAHTQQQHSNLPLILAGFSFGAMVASALAVTVSASKLVLIGPAVTRYDIIIPATMPTIVIHGEDDEVIPLQDVLNWAKNLESAIIWVPETGHFFHGKLSLLSKIINTHVI